MAKQLTPSQVAEVLRRGTFDDLVDALEDEHLECKAAPYQLQHEHQKYELAKDVSMIVNSGVMPLRGRRSGSNICASGKGQVGSARTCRVEKAVRSLVRQAR